MAAAGTMRFEELTRRHGVKVQCSLSVEECSLAIGNVVGHEFIKSASRMNNAIVVFLDTVEKAREVIASGIVVNDTLTPVLPLSSPATKVIISNVPPFISDSVIESNLTRYGRLVSSIRKIPLGCKSPLLKHVVSFRRQVFMVLNEDSEDLDLTMKIKVSGFDYTVFATSDSVLRCFFCHVSGHVVRDCPRKKQSESQPPTGPTEPKEIDTPAVDSLSTTPPATLTEPADPDLPLLVPANLVTSVPANSAENEGTRPPCESAPQCEAREKNDSAPSESELVANIETVSVDDSPPVLELMTSNASVNDMITKELAALSDNKISQPNAAEPTASQRETEEIVNMETDGFKAPKRKERSTDPADCNPSKTKKAGATSGSCDSDNESVCSDTSDISLGELSASGGVLPIQYKAEDISCFLRGTKGQRCVEVEHYFPDRSQFVNDATLFLREKAFTSQETARLRKLLTKLRKKLREEQALSPQTELS